ncbi:MAG: hypothetical protein ACREGB_01660 [Candidatus Saccharimonadales bacterium]
MIVSKEISNWAAVHNEYGYGILSQIARIIQSIEAKDKITEVSDVLALADPTNMYNRACRERDELRAENEDLKANYDVVLQSCNNMGDQRDAKSLEIRSHMARIAELESYAQGLAISQDELRAENDRLTKLMASISHDADKVHIEREELRKKLAGLGNEYAIVCHYKYEMEKLETQNSALTQQLESVNSHIVTIMAEQDALTTQRDGYVQAYDAYKARTFRLVEERKKDNVGITRLREQVQELKDALEVRRAEHHQHLEDKLSLKHQIDVLTQESVEKDKRLDNWYEEYKKLQDSVPYTESLQKECDRLRKIVTDQDHAIEMVEKGKDRRDTQITDLTQKLEGQDKLIDRLNRQAADDETVIDSLRTSVAEQRQAVDDLKTELRERRTYTQLENDRLQKLVVQQESDIEGIKQGIRVNSNIAHGDQMVIAYQRAKLQLVHDALTKLPSSFTNCDVATYEEPLAGIRFQLRKAINRDTALLGTKAITALRRIANYHPVTFDQGQSRWIGSRAVEEARDVLDAMGIKP